MLTKERFRLGMTFQEYLDQMVQNRDRLLQGLAEVEVRPEEQMVFRNLKKKINLLVITEDWCGDALAHFPVLARLVEGAPNVEMRVFLRDKNPDLMDQYLNKGIYRSIPVFVFLDDEMRELGRLIERPAKVTEFIEQKMSETRRALRAQHTGEWRRVAAEEITALLSRPDQTT